MVYKKGIKNVYKNYIHSRHINKSTKLNWESQIILQIAAGWPPLK